MATLNPTLVIGLGSTGLQIIELYRQLLMEEFGTPDVPVIRCIAFETNQSETSETGLKVHGITVDSVQSVRARIDKYPDYPEIKGYKEWLPNAVLNKGDSFRAGAGGVRAAGRLILWENWDSIKQTILSNYQAATSINSRNATIDLIASHKDIHNVNEYIDATDTDDSKVTIYVVGTLCGGSCSGMVQDLGYLLRDNYPDSARILLTTVPTSQEANTDKAQQIAANAYGALRELDFIYHRFDHDDAWQYDLADGNAKAHANTDPYKLVYLLSTSNGSTTLQQSGVSQMLAMNLFLDTVAGGRIGKDAAIVDFGTNMSERIPNADGYVNWFFSFGLSVVWYPKSKITGLASCQIAQRLLSSWLDEKETEIEVIREHVSEDVQEIVKLIEKLLHNEVHTTFEKLKEIAAGLVTNMDHPLSPIVNEEINAKLTTQLANAYDKLREVKIAVGSRLKELVVSRLYEKYQNVPEYLLYFKELRSKIDIIIDGLPTTDAVFPPDLSRLKLIIDVEQNCKKDLLLTAGFMRNPARLFHREKYYDRVQQYWQREITIRKDYILGTMLRLLRVGEGDLRLTDQYIPNANSVLNEIQRDIQNEIVNIQRVKDEVSKQESRFKTLGDIEIIEEIYVDATLENDVSKNVSDIYHNTTTPRADSVDYHLQQLNHPTIESPRQFWVEQSAQQIASTMVNHYQVTGLKLLQKPVDSVDDAKLMALAGHSKPYLEIDKGYNKFASLRPPTFTFANKSPDEIKGIADKVGFSTEDNQCRHIALKHMVFLYHEQRGVPVNMINSFNTSKNHAKRHFYSTHKDVGFYNVDRIERETDAEMLLLAAHKLVKEDIFESRGEGATFNVFKFEDTSGKMEYFKVNDQKNIRALAFNNEAFKALKSKILRVVQRLDRDDYLQRYKNAQEAYLEAIFNADSLGDFNRKEALERKLVLLNRFHLEYVEKNKSDAAAELI